MVRTDAAGATRSLEARADRAPIGAGRGPARGLRGDSTRRPLQAAGAAFLAALAASLLLLGAGPAAAEEYEPSDAGHPLRIAGYVLHPVGVVYDYLLLRPAFWVGSHEPFRTLFGRTD